MIFYTFYCVAFLRCVFSFSFCHVIWVGLSISNVYDYLWLRLESVFRRRYSVSLYVESERQVRCPLPFHCLQVKLGGLTEDAGAATCIRLHRCRPWRPLLILCVGGRERGRGELKKNPLLLHSSVSPLLSASPPPPLSLCKPCSSSLSSSVSINSPLPVIPSILPARSWLSMDLCGCPVYSLCMSQSLGHMSWWCRPFLKTCVVAVVVVVFFSVRHKLAMKEEGTRGSFLLCVVIGVLLGCCFFSLIFVVCILCCVTSWLNDSCAVPLTFSSLLFVSPLCLSVSLTLPVVFLSPFFLEQISMPVCSSLA